MALFKVGVVRADDGMAWYSSKYVKGIRPGPNTGQSLMIYEGPFGTVFYTVEMTPDMLAELINKAEAVGNGAAGDFTITLTGHAQPAT